MINNLGWRVVLGLCKENVDMIVIATHGMAGWRRVVFGSVAERVVRLAKCPVLTTRVSQAEP